MRTIREGINPSLIYQIGKIHICQSAFCVFLTVIPADFVTQIQTNAVNCDYKNY